ncbi:MAG: TRAP transporter substrate-binding protein [Syntrophales bacterium]
MKNKGIFVSLVLIAALAPSMVWGAVQLKFCNYFPTPSQQSKIGEVFIKDIEALSKDQLKITYFPAQTLLTAPKMYDGVFQGIADIGMSHIGYTVGRFKVTETLNLPLGFPNAWVANHVVDDFYRQFKPKEWDKVHVIALHSAPVQVVISAKKPVYKMEDLKGMTLKGQGYVGDVVSALGATPRPIGAPQNYESLQKGVLDGSILPMETLKVFRLAEVAKYVTESWGIGQVDVFYLVMNKDSWNKLPPDIQKIFNEYPFQEKLAAMWNEIDIVGKNYGKEKGLQFIELPPAEMARWKNAVEPVFEKYVKTMVAEGYKEKDVREWINYARMRIDYWTKKQIQLGIKSSTGPAEIRMK